jgi:drug/metabolite transporter (DMT)-like permease
MDAADRARVAADRSLSGGHEPRPRRQMSAMRYSTGFLLACAAAVLWSLMALGLRLIGEASVWEILFWRSVGLLPVAAALIVWTHGSLAGPVLAAGWAGLVGGLALAVSFCGAVYAIQSTAVANAVFLYSAAPFFAALLGRLVLGEAVRASTWAAIALASVGVFVMVCDGLALGAGPGNIAALISAAGFAVLTLAMRARPAGDPAVPVLLGAVFNLGLSLPIALAVGGRIAPPATDILIALALGAVVLGLGLGLYSRGSRAVPAADLALVSMIEVLLAPVWVWLVLNETVTPGTLFGGAILLTALAFNALAAGRAAPSPSPTGGG